MRSSPLVNSLLGRRKPKPEILGGITSYDLRHENTGDGVPDKRRKSAAKRRGRMQRPDQNYGDWTKWA
jgi:hypothetical protein